VTSEYDVIIVGGGIGGLITALALKRLGLGVVVLEKSPGLSEVGAGLWLATTNLPQYAANTIYPHGRRVHAFFTNPAKPPASPTLVGEMIRYVIEGSIFASS